MIEVQKLDQVRKASSTPNIYVIRVRSCVIPLWDTTAVVNHSHLAVNIDLHIVSGFGITFFVCENPLGSIVAEDNRKNNTLKEDKFVWYNLCDTFVWYICVIHLCDTFHSFIISSHLCDIFVQYLHVIHLGKNILWKLCVIRLWIHCVHLFVRHLLGCYTFVWYTYVWYNIVWFVWNICVIQLCETFVCHWYSSCSSSKLLRTRSVSATTTSTANWSDAFRWPRRVKRTLRPSESSPPHRGIPGLLPDSACLRVIRYMLLLLPLSVIYIYIYGIYIWYIYIYSMGYSIYMIYHIYIYIYIYYFGCMVRINEQAKTIQD